jgi:hypothetical protein
MTLFESLMALMLELCAVRHIWYASHLGVGFTGFGLSVVILTDWLTYLFYINGNDCGWTRDLLNTAVLPRCNYASKQHRPSVASPLSASKQHCQARCSGARRNVVGWGTMLQAGRSRFRLSMRSLDFSIDLILPAALWPSSRLSL